MKPKKMTPREKVLFELNIHRNGFYNSIAEQLTGDCIVNRQDPEKICEHIKTLIYEKIADHQHRNNVQTDLDFPNCRPAVDRSRSVLVSRTGKVLARIK